MEYEVKSFLTTLNENLTNSADIKWPAIKHFNEMPISDFTDFFTTFDSCDELYEASEKIDGSQLGIGCDSNGVFLKSKRSGAIYNPSDFYKMSQDYGIEVFKGFGDILKSFRNDESINKWFEKQKEAYKTEFMIFGEMLNMKQPNTLVYPQIKEGHPYIVLFGVCGTQEKNNLFDLRKINYLISDFMRNFSSQDVTIVTKRVIADFDSKHIHGSKPMQALKEFIYSIDASFNSRKRDENTKQIKEKLSVLVDAAYVDVIKSIDKSKSLLGADEIEGIVVINKSNQFITKFVKPKFRDDNADNWKEMKRRRTFRKELKSEVASAATTNELIEILVRFKDKMLKMTSEMQLDDKSSSIKKQAVRRAFDEIDNVASIIDKIKEVKNVNEAKSSIVSALHLESKEVE